MKKVISGKMYSTDTAEEIGRIDEGNPYNGTDYDEYLYKKKTGEFFFYGAGGANSKYRYYKSTGPNSWYQNCGEKIVPISLDEAKRWLEEYFNAEYYEDVFGEVAE